MPHIRQRSRCESNRSLIMLKQYFLTSVECLILWYSFQLFLSFAFSFPCGPTCLLCHPVFSWCSFPKLTYSKMKLQLQNRGSNQSSQSLWTARSYWGEADLQFGCGGRWGGTLSCRRLNQNHRGWTYFLGWFYFPFYTQTNEFCEGYTKSYKQANFTYGESCCLCSTFSW